MGARTELEELRRLDELARRAARTPPVQEKYDPSEGMSTGAKLGAGFISGLQNAASGAVNLAGKVMDYTPSGRLERALFEKTLGRQLPSDYRTPGWASDAERQERADRERDLKGWGTVGKIGGEVAATLPTAALGAPIRALQGARAGAPLLWRTLTSGPVRGATAGLVEGAAQGAVTAAPDEVADKTALGGAFGGALGGAGGVFGRTLRGLVKKSPEAELLDTVAAQHGQTIDLPLSQSASDEGLSGALKAIYGKVLPYLPGGGGIRKQQAKALEGFRELAMKEGAPAGAPSLPGDDIHSSMTAIGDAFEDAYKNTVKSYAFNKPTVEDAAAYLVEKIPNIDATTLENVAGKTSSLLERYSSGKGFLDGDNLIRAKTELARLGRDATDQRTGEAFFQAQEMLDDLVRNELSQGGKAQNLKDLEVYEALSEPWKNFLRVQKAAANAKDTGGRFTADELKGAVKSTSSEHLLAQGKAPLQDLAEVGQKTVGVQTKAPNMFERAATFGTLAAMGLIGGPVGMVGLYGAARGLSSKTVQKALMGNLPAQRALVKVLRDNPQASPLIQRSLTQAQLEDENAEK